LGSAGHYSGGDLAFHNGNLYMASASERLIRINLADVGESVVIGSFGISNIFGLATGTNDVLYGVGDTLVCQISTTTGTARNCVDYAGQSLGSAFGQSFYTEAGAIDLEGDGVRTASPGKDTYIRSS